MQPTNNTHFNYKQLKNKQAMQTQLINTLNGLTLNHYTIAQYCSLYSNTDDSQTQVALLEIKQTTLNNMEGTYDALDSELRLMHDTLQALIPNAQVTRLDETTVYKDPDSGKTLTMCEGDCTMHIMLTYCME